MTADIITNKKESNMTSSSSCPYASPPMYEDDHTSVSNDGSEGTNMTSGQALQLAKNSCPAFANNSCPFKEDIGKAIANMPLSHVMIPSNTSESVRLALKHVHQVSKHTQSSEYQLPGALVNSMDELSFNDVFGNLVTQHQESMLDNTSTDKVTVIEPPQTKTVPILKESKQPVSLSLALKNGTAESHSAAESVHFVKNFAKGIIDKDLFAELTSNLLFVYQTMERLLDTHAPSQFPALHFPEELKRADVLLDDVEFFLGEEKQQPSKATQDYMDRIEFIARTEPFCYVEFFLGEEKQQPSKATKDYMDRIEFIARTEPILLISHAYTRYLGDLSGGRILSRVARKALHLDIDGLRFYEFDKITNPKQFKDNYRLQMDNLTGIDSLQIERLVAEANVAFVLNMRMFEELDVLSDNIPNASVRDLQEATIYYDRCIQNQQILIDNNTADEYIYEIKGMEKCPFANLSGPNPHEPTKQVLPANTEEEKKCPWPFIFMHDPMAGMKEYQTWILIGIVLSWLW
eukprot:CAMPEP_0197840308 /NCGR_PEP_ID=MMETSP1437-20131217/45535_1 /TAXON_ID=49252 ORGANISM="Eucampia antarctica, Strain CCMP1452" /NCGR_SAMPLE_ID=MMETSP1437 /ASSEMBLY_ACC=CAM_ASM_001096 /LENGTH=518 /DNA_ID=CAMNT_0043449903 /DNA_START=51 /DNA_END=1605 /DNA_ORIENTATION=-